MSPKNTLHGGPSHAGDPPPARRSFGAVLAAAREAVDAAEASLERASRRDADAAGEYAEALRVEGQRLVDLTAVLAGVEPAVQANGGVLSGKEPYFVGERGPEPISAADLERLGQQHPAQDVEVSVADTEPEPTTEVEGGEPSSAGTSSSTSPRKRKTSSAPTKQPSRSRARSTGSRSKQDQQVGSTADSAAAPTPSSDPAPIDG